MGATKVTFTLDDQTIHRLQDAAERLAKPKSAVIREAVMEYHDRIGRLSERERRDMLRTFDRVVPKIPRRPAAAVDRELAEVRKARRAGGRRSGRTRG